MKLLKEPLFHFLALGAALFILYGFVSDDSSDSLNRLVVTQGDIRQLADTWQMQWRRPPTPAELQGLVDAHRLLVRRTSISCFARSTASFNSVVSSESR